MADVTPGIITFGLGGDHSNMIIGNIFNLGFFTVDVGVGSPPIVGSPGLPPPIPTPTPGGGGGSFPLAPGQIQRFYRVVDNQWQVPYIQQTILPPDERTVPVVVRIKFMNKTIERNYLVKQKRGDAIINVLNIINTIKSRISITVKNIKRAPSRILAFVRNIRNKDEEQ